MGETHFVDLIHNALRVAKHCDKLFSNLFVGCSMRFSEQSLSSQTAYAELFEQTRAFELSNALAGLSGSFQKLQRKNQEYWYWAFRDVNQQVRMLYVGPDDDRVRALVALFEQTKRTKPLEPAALSALALGNIATAPKHFRMIKRLSDYGFFRAGGVLIGTHAFLVMANLLGVKWHDGAATLDVDFAHAGKNISVALPADLKIDVHDALTSLEMGLLPITQFNGKVGAQYRNPQDAELRIDFVTSMNRSDKPVMIPNLNIALEPLKFMEFSLQDTTQACVISRTGACTVNIPAPQRYAVHKLIVYGERPLSERAKSTKDILQAASLASYFLATGQANVLNTAWQDATNRGKGWQSRAKQGLEALLRAAPELDVAELWS